MSRSPGAMAAAVRRMLLGMPRSTDRAVCGGPTRLEHIETIFRAGHMPGECPSWVLIAIERTERAGREDARGPR